MNWVVLDGDVVAVDPSAGEVHVLQGAAALVWQLLDGEPLAGLTDVVATECGIPANEAADGVVGALELLSQVDLVQA